MSNIVIIPARAGSKGLPNKNIRPLLGKPLIYWSVRHALNSNSVDQVIVSTDCPTIAEISIEAGAQVPSLRPAKLALDTTPTEPVLKHALLNSGINPLPKFLTLLQPTSPLRFRHATDEAFSLIKTKRYRSIVSVSTDKSFHWTDKNSPRASYDYNNRPRRQDIKDKDKKYKENGSIYITEVSGFLETNNRIIPPIGLFEMSQSEALEIDTITDFYIIERLMQESIDEL